MLIKLSRLILLTLAVAILFTGCNNDAGDECVVQPDLSGVKIELQIEEYHKSILGTKSRAELAEFLKKEPIIAEHFFMKSQYPNDSILVEEYFRKFQNPHIDSLGQDIDRVFGDLSALREELTKAFAHLKHYYPEVRLPKVKTVATGLNHDLYVSDSLIVIGLDYYLGPQSKYRPLNMYKYMLQRYSPPYIVPSVMLLYGISPYFNATDLSDKTVLADMLAYGKSFYFAKYMMPCVPDSVLIWYTAEEMKDVRKNSDIVWSHFVQNEILYETSHEIRRKYIQERPKTHDIGPKAPGRIGTWLGWEIIKSYMRQNPGVELEQMMKQQDMKKIFRESKYKP